MSMFCSWEKFHFPRFFINIPVGILMRLHQLQDILENSSAVTMWIVSAVTGVG
jgi:hypothetical protein